MSIALASLVLALPAPSLAPPSGDEVAWVDGPLDVAKATAAERGLPLLLYFWSESSSYSAAVYGETLTQPETAERLARFVCYTANVAADEARELVGVFGVRTLPTVIVLDPTGQPLDSIQGYKSKAAYVSALDRILAGDGVIPDLRARVEAADGDRSEEALLDRWLLAWKLYEVGRRDEHDAILAGIREDDPKSRTLAGSRARLVELVDEAAADAGSQDYSIFRNEIYVTFNGDPTNWDLGPLRSHAKRVKSEEGRFEAWDNLGTLENVRGNVDAAHQAWEKASQVVPDYKAMNWSDAIARNIWGVAEQASSRSKKLALSLAERSAELAEETDTTTEAFRARFGDLGRGSFLAQRLRVLSGICELNGDDERALELLDRCHELDPNGGYDNLARVLRDS